GQGSQDVGTDGVALLVGTDGVEHFGDGDRTADDWFALYVAADVMRHGSVDGGLDELSLGRDADRMDRRGVAPGSTGKLLDGMEEEIWALMVDADADVTVPERRKFVDDVGTERSLDEEFLAYMCTVGCQWIFDDPGDTPSSVDYNGLYRNMDE
ncbi:hypothetical protein EST38_g13241, partial [Candolleomyces aberdarensis]